MIFKATDEQILQVECNAINSSIPAGMGFLHATSKVFRSKDISIKYDQINMDYVQGRMVKLMIKRVKDNEWECVGSSPRSDYQSWCHKYPTYEALVSSVVELV